ncbi:MAG: hypothetical protein ABI705_05960 [Aestuariivirga sp.]
MSNIANDLIPFETQTEMEPQNAHVANTRTANWRDSEFHSALDHYMGIFARASALIG